MNNQLYFVQRGSPHYASLASSFNTAMQVWNQGPSRERPKGVEECTEISYNSTNTSHIRTAQSRLQAAHQSMGILPGVRLHQERGRKRSPGNQGIPTRAIFPTRRGGYRKIADPRTLNLRYRSRPMHTIGRAIPSPAWP